MVLRTPSAGEGNFPGRKYWAESYDVDPMDESSYPWKEGCEDCLMMRSTIEIEARTFFGWMSVGRHFLKDHRTLLAVTREDQPRSWRVTS